MADATFLTLTVLSPVHVLPRKDGDPVYHCGCSVRLTASDEGAVALTEMMGCYDAWAFLSTGHFAMAEIPLGLLADIEVERDRDAHGEVRGFLLRNRRTGATLDPLGVGGFPSGRTVNDLSVCIDLARQEDNDGFKAVLGILATGTHVDWFAKDSRGIREDGAAPWYIDGDDLPPAAPVAPVNHASDEAPAHA